MFTPLRKGSNFCTKMNVLWMVCFADDNEMRYVLFVYQHSCQHYKPLKKVIFAVEHYLSSSENKAWKKFRPVRDLNPWPLRYRCSAYRPEFFSGLIFITTQVVFYCEDHLLHVFIRSSNIRLSYIHSRYYKSLVVNPTNECRVW